jgi:hypothetical protein
LTNKHWGTGGPSVSASSWCSNRLEMSQTSQLEHACDILPEEIIKLLILDSDIAAQCRDHNYY